MRMSSTVMCFKCNSCYTVVIMVPLLTWQLKLLIHAWSKRRFSFTEYFLIDIIVFTEACFDRINLCSYSTGNYCFSTQISINRNKYMHTPTYANLCIYLHLFTVISSYIWMYGQKGCVWICFHSQNLFAGFVIA